MHIQCLILFNNTCGHEVEWGLFALFHEIHITLIHNKTVVHTQLILKKMKSILKTQNKKYMNI